MGKDKKSGKKPEFWLKWKNIEKEMKKIIKKNGKNFPSLQELRRLDYENQDIEKAIMRHGLTLDEVRIKMGIKSKETSSRDKMLDLLEASTSSFLSNVREIKEERQEFMSRRRTVTIDIDTEEKPKKEPEIQLEVVQPKPVSPQIPTTPAIPMKPVTPQIPTTPAIPMKPKTPAVPQTPVIPATPQLPIRPPVSQFKQVKPPGPSDARPAPPKIIGSTPLQPQGSLQSPPRAPGIGEPKEDIGPSAEDITARLKAFKEKLKKFDV